MTNSNGLKFFIFVPAKLGRLDRTAKYQHTMKCCPACGGTLVLFHEKFGELNGEFRARLGSTGSGSGRASTGPEPRPWNPPTKGNPPKGALHGGWYCSTCGVHIMPEQKPSETSSQSAKHASRSMEDLKNAPKYADSDTSSSSFKGKVVDEHFEELAGHFHQSFLTLMSHVREHFLLKEAQLKEYQVDLCQRERMLRANEEYMDQRFGNLQSAEDVISSKTERLHVYKDSMLAQLEVRGQQLSKYETSLREWREQMIRELHPGRQEPLTVHTDYGTPSAQGQLQYANMEHVSRPQRRDSVTNPDYMNRPLLRESPTNPNYTNHPQQQDAANKPECMDHRTLNPHAVRYSQNGDDHQYNSRSDLNTTAPVPGHPYPQVVKPRSRSYGGAGEQGDRRSVRQSWHEQAPLPGRAESSQALRGSRTDVSGQGLTAKPPLPTQQRFGPLYQCQRPAPREQALAAHAQEESGSDRHSLERPLSPQKDDNNNAMDSPSSKPSADRDSGYTSTSVSMNRSDSPDRLAGSDLPGSYEASSTRHGQQGFQGDPDKTKPLRVYTTAQVRPNGYPLSYQSNPSRSSPAVQIPSGISVHQSAQLPPADGKNTSSSYGPYQRSVPAHASSRTWSTAPRTWLEGPRRVTEL